MIYMDFDDVLCETARGLLALAAREFGWRGRFEEIRSFDLDVSFRLKASELDRLMQLAHEPDELLGLEPVPGAAEGMRSLASAGREVAVVTGRPAWSREASSEWLRRHNVPHSALLFVDKYGRARGGDDGAGVMSLEDIRKAGFELAVEDAPAMLRFLAERTAVPLIVFDRPWNAEAVLGLNGPAARLIRCRGWSEISRRAVEICARAREEPCLPEEPRTLLTCR
jgi:uncharacterized protein